MNPHPSIDTKPECSNMSDDPTQVRFFCKWCRNTDVSPDAFICFRCGKDVLEELRTIQMYYAGLGA